MAPRPDTTTGTITLTNGLTAFTTVGTNMMTRGHLPGDTIRRNGLVLTIATITGENTGTLEDPCPAGAAGAGVPVRIRWQADGSRVAAQTRNMIDVLGNGNLQAEAALVGAADRVSYYTGIGTKALTVLTAAARALLAGVDQAAMRTALGFTTFSTQLAGLTSSDALADLLGIPKSDILPQGRLTLTNGVVIPTSDVIGANKIYYQPAIGDRVPIWDAASSRHKTYSIGAGLQQTLDPDNTHVGYHGLSVYDLYVTLIAGVPRLVTGRNWIGSNSRGFGAGTAQIQKRGGVWTNSIDMTMRFGIGAADYVTVLAGQATLLGTFAPDTVVGQATDAAAKRLLCNAYNAVPRILETVGTGTTSAYSTGTFQLMNASALSAVPFVQCLDGVLVTVDASVTAVTNNTATARQVLTGIGVNSSTINSATRYLSGWAANSFSVPPVAELKYYPPVGYNSLSWLQLGGGADTQTWYLSAGSRMVAEIML